MREFSFLLVSGVAWRSVLDQFHEVVQTEAQEGHFLALWNTVRAHLPDRGAIESAILSSQRDAHLDGEGSHHSDGNTPGDPDLAELIDVVTRLATNQVRRTIATDCRCGECEVPAGRDVPGVVLRVEVS